MELVYIGLTLLSAGFIGLLIRHKNLLSIVNKLRKTQVSLREDIDGEGGAWPLDRGLKSKVEELRESIREAKQIQDLLLKIAYPTLKDDIDLVMQVDFANATSVELEGDLLYIKTPSKLSKFERTARSLHEVLKRAEEIKQLRDKICPDKCPETKAKK